MYDLIINFEMRFQRDIHSITITITSCDIHLYSEREEKGKADAIATETLLCTFSNQDEGWSISLSLSKWNESRLFLFLIKNCVWFFSPRNGSTCTATGFKNRPTDFPFRESCDSHSRRRFCDIRSIQMMFSRCSVSLFHAFFYLVNSIVLEMLRFSIPLGLFLIKCVTLSNHLSRLWVSWSMNCR